MAKETKKERRAAGKKAWRDKVKNARAAGKKTIKVGKHHIKLSELGKSGNKSGGSKAHRKHGGRPKMSAAHRTSVRRRREEIVAAHYSKPKRKRSKRKAHAKSHHRGSRRGHHHTRTVTKLRTVRVKVPGKTRNVYVTAAERRGGHRRRAREGYAMENPLSTMEIIAGGLTMLLGLAVADVSDRYWATHALTASTSGTTTTYTDTPAVTSSTGMATFGTGLYPSMLNGASVMAPMNLTRWVSGGVLAAVPFIAAAFIKQPTARTAAQLFGFGVIARIGGKALVDLFAGLLGSTSLGQQLYVNELAATAQYQVAQGQTTTITLPSPGTNPPTAGGPSGSASGLAKPHQISTCCSGCASGRPCVRSQNAHGAAQSPPASVSQPFAPQAPVSVVVPVGATNAYGQPTPANPANTIPDASTTGLSGPSRRALPERQKTNPYAWSDHVLAGATRH